MAPGDFKAFPLVARAACLALSLCGAPALATESGGSSYVLGVESNTGGMLPPQDGLQAFAYYQHYGASHTKDDAGEDNKRLAYYKVRLDGLGIRLVYVWPQLTLLGARVQSAAVLAVPTVNLSLGVARPTPSGPLDLSGSKTALADMQIEPLRLSWSNDTLHQSLGFDLFAPTGQFDKNARVNIGRNYWQVAPLYGVTWLPGQARLAAKTRYAMNGTNHDTDYASGNELSLEYSAGYAVQRFLELGVNGYLYRQTSDDEQVGMAVNGNGNRGRVNAIGPYATFFFGPGIFVSAKLQIESGARNRPQGTRLWLQTKIPL